MTSVATAAAITPAIAAPMICPVPPGIPVKDMPEPAMTPLRAGAFRQQRIGCAGIAGNDVFGLPASRRPSAGRPAPQGEGQQHHDQQEHNHEGHRAPFRDGSKRHV